MKITPEIRQVITQIVDEGETTRYAFTKKGLDSFIDESYLDYWKFMPYALHRREGLTAGEIVELSLVEPNGHLNIGRSLVTTVRNNLDKLVKAGLLRIVK